jgi:hypothetical protein
LHEIAGSEAAQFFYHDLAGWLMMPAALGMLWVAYWLFIRLFPARAPGVW